jgi:hypothetical protein
MPTQPVRLHCHAAQLRLGAVLRVVRRNIGYDPTYTFLIAGDYWTGLGVHEPYNACPHTVHTTPTASSALFSLMALHCVCCRYNDNYVYAGRANTSRFSGQWSAQTLLVRRTPAETHTCRAAPLQSQMPHRARKRCHEAAAQTS